MLNFACICSYRGSPVKATWVFEVRTLPLVLGMPWPLLLSFSATHTYPMVICKNTIHGLCAFFPTLQSAICSILPAMDREGRTYHKRYAIWRMCLSPPSLYSGLLAPPQICHLCLDITSNIQGRFLSPEKIENMWKQWVHQAEAEKQLPTLARTHMCLFVTGPAVGCRNVKPPALGREGALNGTVCHWSITHLIRFLKI